MSRRSEGQEAPPQLLCDEQGLFLSDGSLELRVDFASMLPRLSKSAVAGELLVRAAKVSRETPNCPPLAIDATAGLAEDAFLLASAGFSVELYERNPTIAALLADALARAADIEELRPIVSRMRLHEEDSIAALPTLVERAPDVVYLDPMFPPSRKSAAAKKKFQLLRRIAEPPEDEGEGGGAPDRQEALFAAALAAQPRKIVIKRPLKGPYLAGRKPSYSIRGKAIRYDCFALSPSRASMGS